MKLEMLGNLEDWSDAGASEAFKVRALESRLADLRALVDGYRKCRQMTTADAASLRGKLLNLSFTKPSRTGRGNYHALNALADGFSGGWSHALELEMTFIRFELGSEFCRECPLIKCVGKQTRCWSDASFDDGVDGPSMKMCAIVCNNSSKCGVVCDASSAFFDALCPRATQIMAGELFAVILAFAFFPEAFRNASAINFVDNIGVIHNIVNGASSQLDLGSMVLGLHRRLALLKVSIWWEYVPSPSNISDGGSRVGITCPLAKEAGISLKQVPCSILPHGFPFSHPVVWDEWWSAH